MNQSDFESKLKNLSLVEPSKRYQDEAKEIFEDKKRYSGLVTWNRVLAFSLSLSILANFWLMSGTEVNIDEINTAQTVQAAQKLTAGRSIHYNVVADDEYVNAVEILEIKE